MSSRKSLMGRKRKAHPKEDDLPEPALVHSSPPSSPPPPPKRAKRTKEESKGSAIITYVGPDGRIFERLFQDGLSLEGMQTIVRKKMKYPTETQIDLVQLREGLGRDGKLETKMIDLDDEDDFEVFQHRASDPKASITISFNPTLPSAATPSAKPSLSAPHKPLLELKQPIPPPAPTPKPKKALTSLTTPSAPTPPTPAPATSSKRKSTSKASFPVDQPPPPLTLETTSSVTGSTSKRRKTLPQSTSVPAPPTPTPTPAASAPTPAVVKPITPKARTSLAKTVVSQAAAPFNPTLTPSTAPAKTPQLPKPSPAPSNATPKLGETGWLPPTLAAAVARKSLSLNGVGTPLKNLLEQEKPVEASDKEVEEESGEEDEEGEVESVIEDEPEAADKLAGSAVIPPFVESFAVGLLSSYEFGAKEPKMAEESSEDEAPSGSTLVRKEKPIAKPVVRRASSPIEPPTPGQPQRPRFLTPPSSPPGGHSSPEKQPHSDVYLEDDGEGSTSESSSDEGESSADEHPPSGQTPPAVQNQEQEEEDEGKVLVPSSSAPPMEPSQSQQSISGHGKKPFTQRPSFAPLPGASSDPEASETEDEDEEYDDAVQYSDATVSPPKRRRPSTMSAKGRKSGVESESEGEGILPPGVKDSDEEERDAEERETEESEAIGSFSEQHGGLSQMDVEEEEDEVVDEEEDPKVAVSSPPAARSSSHPTWKAPSPVADQDCASFIPAIALHPRRSLGDLDGLDFSQPSLTYSKLDQALEEVNEMDGEVDNDSGGGAGSVYESMVGYAQPAKEPTPLTRSGSALDSVGEPRRSKRQASVAAEPISAGPASKPSSTAAPKENESLREETEEGAPAVQPPAVLIDDRVSVPSSSAPSGPATTPAPAPKKKGRVSNLTSGPSTPKPLTAAELAKEKRMAVRAQKAEDSRLKAQVVAAKHDAAIEKALKAGKPLSKMLQNYLEKKKIKEEEARIVEEAKADLDILRAGRKEQEMQAGVGQEADDDDEDEEGEQEEEEQQLEAEKTSEDVPSTSTPSNTVASSKTTPKTTLPYSRNRPATAPRPSSIANLNGTIPTPSLYPSIPLPLPSSSIAIPSSSQRRAPALSDLSQRSKAEFAVAGSESAKARGARESSVLGRLGGWITGKGTPNGKSVQVEENEESSSGEEDEEDEDSSEEEGKGKKALAAKAVRGRIASGKKVGRPKKSLLGSLVG